MANIREDKGYTYGIGSAIIPNIQDGSFFIASEVGKDVVEDALVQVYAELKKLTVEAVSEDELTLVKSYMVGTIQRSIDGPFSLADRYKGLILWNLDYDYLENYVTLIHNITPEKVNELASKYLHPDMMSEVVSG
jgi:predicted Zn-dependent peptidase